MTPEPFYWCRSCGRISALAEVALWGPDVMPYLCPGCRVEKTDDEGAVVSYEMPPGRYDLRPWSWAKEENPNLPDRPRSGDVYPPGASAT